MSEIIWKRWNFETRGGELWVCKDHHEKSQPCEYEELASGDALELLEEMRAVVLSQAEEIKTLKDESFRANARLAIADPDCETLNMVDENGNIIPG